MSIALVKTRPLQPHQRSASEDARHLLLKGFVCNLSWSAAVHSIATTLLDCDYDDLLSPRLYFTSELDLREAFEQIGLLSWSQWTEWVEAAIWVKNYQTSYPSSAKQVIDAVGYLKSCGQILSKSNLEKTYLQLQTTHYPSANLRSINMQSSQAIVETKSSTKIVQHKTKKSQPSALKYAQSQRQIRQLKRTLKLLKSAFVTLDHRAKSKLVAREALSQKLICYLSLVSQSRQQLRLEKPSPVYRVLCGFYNRYTADYILIGLTHDKSNTRYASTANDQAETTAKKQAKNKQHRTLIKRSGQTQTTA
ncbi:MAG: hypothetical protein Q9M92_04205 [Enterobacterales bacterium]|nr:hypothetical protein [Enterobacterales bacterium]